MTFLSMIGAAFQALRVNPLRTFLTMLGMVRGVGATSRGEGPHEVGIGTPASGAPTPAPQALPRLSVGLARGAA